MNQKMTVSRLAERVGSTPSALRYYERIGLLPEPRRSEGGYRLYDDTAEERVRFIKRAQRFGLRLDEISDLLAIRENGLCPCGHTRTLLRTRLAEIDQEMAGLASLRADIARMVEDLPASDGASEWGCAGALVSPARQAPAHDDDDLNQGAHEMNTQSTCQCGCGTAVETAPPTRATEPCGCGCGAPVETPAKTPAVATGACGCGTESSHPGDATAEACTCGCCDPVPA